ncbi:unnamed protein product, partial [Durusdinium trenchii]
SQMKSGSQRNLISKEGQHMLPVVLPKLLFVKPPPEEDDRALILQERWLKQILARTKVLELRGRQARCGLVWLAHRSCLYGRARIAACEELSATRFALLRSEHGVLQGPPPYKRTWGLWLEDVLLLKKPVKFWKRWGAIGWARVRFSKQTTSQQQLGSGPQKLEDDPRENHATEVRGGLCNIGNSCFMNSVLQLIYAVPLLMRSIMEHRRAVHCGDACLRCLLQQTQVSRAGNAPLERRVAVEGLLCAYRAGSNCVEQLAAMEHFSCELRETEWSTFCERLWNAVEEYMQSEIVAAEAVELEAPLWRTCFLPIVVLFDAWSKTTGLPTVFYLDAFYSLISSLLNKNITFNAANFACRARYWAVGTAAPGSGKSPALDPLKNALVEVMKEMPDLSPGEATDHFHMQPVGTHCAAIDRLQSTGGYEFFGASEGGPVLCPSWPTQSKWEQGGYVNWQRYLDAATGGPVPWETAVDRQKRRVNRDGSASAACDERTNVAVFIMQQESVFRKWWAAAEEKCSIGIHVLSRVAYSICDASRSRTSAGCSEAEDEEEALEHGEKSEGMSASEHGTWEELTTGVLPHAITSYADLRECVETVLGRCKDPGVHVFHQKAAKEGFALLSHCQKTVCQGCTFQVKARATSTLSGSKLEVCKKGKHGKLTAPEGGSLWNAAEAFAIKEAHKDSEMTARTVRLALKQAELDFRCTKVQLYNYVGRCRQKTGIPQKAVSKVPIADLEKAAADFMVRDISQILLVADVAQLVVLPSSVVSEDQVCILWTCPGMLKRAKAAQNKLVKLVIDGKQKILSNEYAILTLSFLVSSDKIARTKAGRSRSKTTDVYTSTQEPFLQALVNTESAENVSKVFTVAIEIANVCCKLDLKAQAFFHTKGIVEKDKGGQGQARAARQADDFATLDEIIQISRILPTAQIFDLVWHFTFAWLETRSKKAVQYLQDTYFRLLTPQSLGKQFRCNRGSWNPEALWFAGFWSGIIGTYPGTASGSQTIESFHARWQAQVQGSVRASPQDIFKNMQKLFSSTWKDQFEWEESKIFRTWPETTASALLNGQTLRSTGRSPAVDFWNARELRMDKTRNYCHVVLRTDNADNPGIDGLTNFWVMGAQKQDGMLPAQVAIREAFAQRLCSMIAAEGDALITAVKAAGILEENKINLTALRKCFKTHAVVLQ